MKILNVYRSAPNETTQKLVEIVSEGREADSFDLNVDSPDYDNLVDKIFAADQTVCWWQSTGKYACLLVRETICRCSFFQAQALGRRAET